jgi:hypothetical protein
MEEIQQNNTETKTNVKKNKLPLLLVGAFLILLAIAGFVWQQNKINKLNNEVAELKKTQLPQKRYSSYEDCIKNDGVLLNTINGQFDACLGGDEDESGELPQHQAFLQYHAQNLPRLEDKTRVDGDPNSLNDFVKASTGCPGKIVNELPNRFAIVTCTDQKDTYSLAIKLADGWRWISTTNNMNEKGQPSCLVVDMFKVSKEITPKCFENTGYNNGTLKDVKYL